jgi:protein-S-isoprenylcysteine O-methyltransferase Ste14
MSQIFIVTIIFVWLTISVESASLILQLKGKKLSRWFGPKAFAFHAITTGLFWIIAFSLIVVLQFGRHPFFHQIAALKYGGLILSVCGLILASWGLKLLGLKRTLCLNFFEENIPVVKNSLYRFIKNPEDYGLWMIFGGFALFTRSSYKLIIAIEFMVVMIPHIILESRPLKK